MCTSESAQTLRFESAQTLQWASTLKSRNICLNLPSKLEIQTASAAKNAHFIWVWPVPPDGISWALSVMQLADNTSPIDLISCNRFIQSKQASVFGILSEKFPTILRKLQFKYSPHHTKIKLISLTFRIFTIGLSQCRLYCSLVK